jgi:hypothetical protein
VIYHGKRSKRHLESFEHICGHKIFEVRWNAGLSTTFFVILDTQIYPHENPRTVIEIINDLEWGLSLVDSGGGRWYVITGEGEEITFSPGVRSETEISSL